MTSSENRLIFLQKLNSSNKAINLSATFRSLDYLRKRNRKKTSAHAAGQDTKI